MSSRNLIVAAVSALIAASCASQPISPNGQRLGLTAGDTDGTWKYKQGEDSIAVNSVLLQGDAPIDELDYFTIAGDKEAADYVTAMHGWGGLITALGAGIGKINQRLHGREA